MTRLEKEILDLLKENARLPLKDIAGMLGVDEQAVKNSISEL